MIKIIHLNSNSYKGRFAPILLELTELDQRSTFNEFRLSDQTNQCLTAGPVQSRIVRDSLIILIIKIWHSPCLTEVVETRELSNEQRDLEKIHKNMEFEKKSEILIAH